jgi:pSer/pThr/pTyr-binding forkhead associated (FHA) protein
MAPVTQLVARRDPELLPEGAPRYLILSEGNAETVFRLARRTTIGRAEDNDIAITRASISRHHAVIMSGPRQTVIEDLNSTNSVLVNKQRVREAVLRDGDVVHIGKCRFRFTSRLRGPGKP